MVQPVYKYRTRLVPIADILFYYKNNLLIHIKIFNLFSLLPISFFIKKTAFLSLLSVIEYSYLR